MPQRLRWQLLLVHGSTTRYVRPCNYGMKRVHGHSSMIEGLDYIHEDGDMPYRPRHGTNIECSIECSTQVVAKGRTKGLH